MPDLIACIIAYNEEDLLGQCLQSIIHKVDKTVVVEGRIAAFPGDCVRSADQTIKIARDYGCEVITSDAPYPDEAAMRSRYLIGNPGDWYILIDADEKCMTPLPTVGTLNNYDAGTYSVNVRMIGAPVDVWRPRLFRHVGQMEYRNIHDALFSDGKLISRPTGTPRLHSIWFAHYQMARDKQRRANKQIYYSNGYEHEPQYRKDWSMFNG